MNPTLKIAIKNDISSVDKTLAKIIKPESKLSFDVYRQVIDSGKRLRPLIVLYSALSLGYEKRDKSLLLGCIVELIHTASLLHDDIVDDATLRRGRPSANNIYGTKPAVLGGDYLYSLAFNMVLDFDVAIAKVISKAAYLLAEGEIKEIECAFKADINRDEYYDIIYKKTAVLLEASSISGCLLADGAYRDAFEQYGKSLGFAFQIKDDCLDYESENESLGKNAGIDLKEGKITLPVLIAIKKDASLAAQIERFFKDKDEGLLKDIMDNVRKNGLKDAVLEAEKFANKAKESLKDVPKGKYRDYLLAIADYAVERKR